MGATPESISATQPEPVAPAAIPSSPPPANVPWVSMAWFLGLMVLCFFPVLQGLVRQWSNDDDMGHGFFVPVLAAYIAWQTREDWLKLDWKGGTLGLVLIAWAALQLMIGYLGAELFLQRTSIVISLVGAVLFLGGWQVLKALAFPLFLVIFMIPLPAIIYNQITFPLQLFASAVAENVLGLIGIPVLREGNVLELASQKLSVVEACSGIRSLLSLTFLSLVYGYFFEKKTFMRVLLLFATIPIAIVANAGRVTLTGILSEINKDFASGFFHSVEGWVIFMIALLLLLGFHKLANKIYGMTHREQPIQVS